MLADQLPFDQFEVPDLNHTELVGFRDLALRDLKVVWKHLDYIDCLASYKGCPSQEASGVFYDDGTDCWWGQGRERWVED